MTRTTKTDDAEAETRRAAADAARRRRRFRTCSSAARTSIVQVSKEPISTKGPRVTAQVSLAGRFLVFMPFAPIASA